MAIRSKVQTAYCTWELSRWRMWVENGDVSRAAFIDPRDDETPPQQMGQRSGVTGTTNLSRAFSL